MNRTPIEWVVNPDGTQGFTSNPITGCLHGCDYCYARKIAMRFQGNFEPKFHPERLNDIFKLRKPSTIFVGSMSDIFGDWIKIEWIVKILEVVHACPQHTFLFLTKNGSRMCHDGDVIDTTNAWYGQTCTGIPARPIWQIPNDRHFVSFEPLMGQWIPDLRAMRVNWIIIGALNTNGKPCYTKKEWVLNLIEQADNLQIPVFIKDSLCELYPDLPHRRELPYLKPLLLGKITNNS